MNSPDRARRVATRTRPSRPRSTAGLRAVPLAVRWSRVATARARIAADFYRRREVRDRLIDALLAELATK